MRFAHGRLLSLGVAGVLAVGTIGCAPRLRAIPSPAQSAIEGNRGIFEFREGLSVSAVAVGRPPIAAEGEFTAFGIELHNNSPASIGIDVNRLQLGLGDGDHWLDRGLVPPDDLVRAYQSADAAPRDPASAGPEGRRFVEVTPPETARYVRGYAVRHGPPCYPYRRVYVFHDYGYYGYYDSARYAYVMQQERASFLARLLRSQEIPPNHVAGGYVVFPQSVRKGDQYRLLIPVGVNRVVASQPSTVPVAPVAVFRQVAVFEFHFVAR